MASSWSAVSSKSKTSMFSAIRDGVTDLGMTRRPCCRGQRSITWAGVRPCSAAIACMVGFWRVLPREPSR